MLDKTESCRSFVAGSTDAKKLSRFSQMLNDCITTLVVL